MDNTTPPAPNATTKLVSNRSRERRRPPRHSEACLIVIQGANVGRRTILDKEALVIGRAKDANIPIDEAAVSRRHAIIRKREQVFFIEDQNSKNGTFVNGEKCREAALQDQDLIEIGDTLFKFIAGNSLELAYHEELHKLATLDPMLGILNKRSFLDYLEQKCARAHISGVEFALVLFDIDHFKRVNDTYGHGAGDQVLREVARTVAANLRGGDLFGRYGGEEFAILLPETDAEQAMRVAEKLRLAVEAVAVVQDPNPTPIQVTISLGIARFDPDETPPVPPRLLLDRADNALYQAKRSGRNRALTHTP